MAEDYSLHWFDPRQPVGCGRGGNLPHWRQMGSRYFVTWRTADSMPEAKVKQWVQEREAWLAKHPEPHDDQAKAEYDALFLARWERWLDECHGECLLKRPEIRDVVERAMRHFDQARYRLGEFIVMSNHVHVVITPWGDHTLSAILHSWKSFTSHEINRMLQRTGTLWQKESFDHIVRSPEEMERIVSYIRNNGRR